MNFRLYVLHLQQNVLTLNMCAPLSWGSKVWITCTWYSCIPKSLFCIHHTLDCKRLHSVLNHFTDFPELQKFFLHCNEFFWRPTCSSVTTVFYAIICYRTCFNKLVIHLINSQPRRWVIIELSTKCLLHDCQRLICNLPSFLQTQSCCHFICLFRLKSL
jgi:hypothetical protein